jgi:hypothetical protein
VEDGEEEQTAMEVDEESGDDSGQDSEGDSDPSDDEARETLSAEKRQKLEKRKSLSAIEVCKFAGQRAPLEPRVLQGETIGALVLCGFVPELIAADDGPVSCPSGNPLNRLLFI